jgi:hypothetical protein
MFNTNAANVLAIQSFTVPKKKIYCTKIAPTLSWPMIIMYANCRKYEVTQVII